MSYIRNCNITKYIINICLLNCDNIPRNRRDIDIMWENRENINIIKKYVYNDLINNKIHLKLFINKFKYKYKTDNIDYIIKYSSYDELYTFYKFILQT